MNLISLIQDEGWDIRRVGNQLVVVTPYEDEIGHLKVQHPVLIHLNIFKDHNNPAIKYQHLKKAHDILWPNRVFHYWTERRFMTHCESWNYITLAAGASASKSFDEASYAVLFWYANPKERNVTIASVTQASLLTRVWGYLTAHIKEMAVPLPYKYFSSNPPRILFEEAVQIRHKISDDTLHGIFAITARVGDNDQAIATWIGKHPKDKILLILDEATDMPMSILNALPNLNSHPEKFQLVAIGNSNSTMDLHGLLSTPANGWGSVSPDLIQWRTTQENGTCLYFSPYESPAIHDPDPLRRKILSRFLIGKETLTKKETELGVTSEKFYRWVLGFWKSRNLEEVTVTEAFLEDTDFYQPGRVDWSGFYPLFRVAGLDPAFSTEGDKCIFRMGVVGHSMDNKIKIDLGNGQHTHEIKLSAINGVSMERQVGEEAIKLLMHYKIQLDHFAIDVTGQGRAIGEVIFLLNSMKGYPLGFGIPLKIYSMSHHNMYRRKKSPPDIIPFNSYILWNDLRSYIEQKHIANLDDATRYQLTQRRIINTEAKGKRASRLESKLEYKRRMSAIGNPHSPDEADAAALLIQVVKMRLGIVPGTVWNRPPQRMDARSQDKLLAWSGQAATERRDQKNRLTLEANFAGDLHSYVINSKPF
jgi:hypothetical protein